MIENKKSYGILAKLSVIIILLMIVRQVLLIGLTLMLPFVFAENQWLSILIVPFLALIIWGIFPVCKVLWGMLR